MIMDKRVEFADATALNTGAAGTYNLGNVVDTSVAQNIGAGHQAYIVFEVTTAVTSAGAATVAFQIVSDATGTISTTTQSIHAASAAIAKASLVAGFQVVLPLPPEAGVPYEEFLAVQQVTGTAALTAGAVNAFLTYDPPANWKSYADAVN